MMNRVCLAVIGILACGQLAFASQTNEPDAISMSRHLMVEMRAVAKLQNEQHRVRSLLGLFQKFADFDGFVRLTLYDHWGQLSDSQKQDFSSAFKTSLLRRITERESSYKKRTVLHWRDLGDERVGGYEKTTIKILSSRGNLVLTLYWIRNPEWRVVDVEMSGASLAVNYQGQFNKVIRDHGFDELLRRVRNGGV